MKRRRQKSVRLNIKLSEEMHRKLRLAVAGDGTTIQDWVVTLLDAALRNK